jgi:hypothetical protein
MEPSDGRFTAVPDQRESARQSTPSHARSSGQGRRGVFARPTRLVAAASALLLPVVMGFPAVVATNAAAATVGQGFTVTPSDLAFILKQIKIAEAHVANTTSGTGPCGALVGNGPNQLASPLLSFGLRTVDGSCNNLQPDQETFGAADQLFPRLTTAVFKAAESNPPLFGPPAASSYAQKTGNVFDTQPRTVSNLVVDQTNTNPAAIAAAGFPVRTQGNPGIVPCTTDPDPVAGVAAAPTDCTPSHKTLFIPNVTTDVGLSPPYNSLFTLFGQFFDHGIDQTVKGGGTVFVPLKDDDPLVLLGPDGKAGTGDEVPVGQRFMVLTRGKNQPGADGVLGTTDDVQDSMNTDSPWVDQSQTYTSHPSHQVFLREYVNNAVLRPVSTGKLLGGPAGPTAGGMATWATVKAQAATLLGLRLTDKDVLDVPMIATDPYGKFIPGPARGLPQYVTTSSTTPLVEGNVASPVAVPTDVRHFDTPFLTDIAHNADPGTVGPCTTAIGVTPRAPAGCLSPDASPTASANFASQPAGTYDDEMLNAHFAAGDGRVNENIGLTTIHQIFHSEHDRLVDYIENVLTTDTSASGTAALGEWKSALGAPSGAAGQASWNGERLFQAARFVTEMEYQHLVFEEFARKIQPAINPFEPFAFTQTEINPAIKAEFAHAVYRFGHSMLTETISRTNEDGANNDISLLEGFLNPPSYTDGGSVSPTDPTRRQLTSEEAAGSVIMGMSDQVANELDEFVTETLRNNLLGLPLDLPSINMARARSEGVPALNVLRRQLFNSTNDGQLTPYTSWVDYGENIKHPESLVNFVAAYGQHPTITAATTLAGKRAAAKAIVNPVLGAPVLADAAEFMNSTGAWANTGTTSRTGLDNIDLWVGGLAENTTPFGGLLGTTFNYVFENQLTDLQNGDRLYYLARTPGMNLRTQLEGNSFAELMMRNTNVHTLKADAFATADCKFQLSNLAGTPVGFSAVGGGNLVADDPASDCNEAALLIRQPDGTIQYRAANSVDPPGINGQSVYNGTAGVDRVRGGNDNDTFWGGLGNDVIEGGAGADVALGGEGDDIITDLAGDDVPKGGPGNDAIDAGPGLDIVMGGEGKDFTNGGANANETFGGEGDDFIMLGESLDAAFGDSGDDFEEGGDQPDLMQGDSGNLFFLDDSQKPGSDILVGQGGDDDYDMEGGDDIGVGGPGIEKVAGASGFDWEIGQGDPQPQDGDLALPIAPLDILQAGVRDKFNEVEALSGWKFDDRLRGDDVVPADVGGGGFIGSDFLTQASVDRISGLATLLPADATANGATWGRGNILLGGAGSDLIEGRGADDIIDGDKYLSVRLSVRTDPANPLTETGSAGIEAPGQSAMTSQYLRNAAGALTGPTLQAAVFAGTVNPGNIVAVREILTGSGGTDTAAFSGIEANYTVTTTGGVLGSPGSVTTVVDNVGTDGTDTLRNIERLAFSDTAPVVPVLQGAARIGTSVAGNASVTVNWLAPLTVTNAAPVTGYVVRTFVGASVTPLRTTTVGNLTSTVIATLTNGTGYTFDVAAVNSVGTGPASARSAAVTPRALAGAPTIGAPTAGNASATVRWTAPASDGGSAITGYSVRAFAGTVLARTQAITGNVASAVVPGLTNGTAYTFDVAAVNAAGTGTASSRSAAVTPATVSGAPRIATAVAGNGSALARWTPPASNGGSAITGYHVRMVDAATGTRVFALRDTTASATSLNFTGLVNGQSYRFQVQARNAVGTGPVSAHSNAVTPATVPGAPRIATAVAGNGSALARWTPPASNGGSAITGYHVRMVDAATGTRVFALRDTTASATSLNFAGLAGGTAVRFQVQARNAKGTGPVSAHSNAVTAR